ncbi:MAG: hypothetical protein KF914_01995 [Rhizobiaceae bacterium]|nr:hypothetical protein [Rhizobiaceae bacterium]
MLRRRTEDLPIAAGNTPSQRRLRHARVRAWASTIAKRRSDIIVATMGLSLGLGCALFPWYIFFNQEKFGIRAMKFAGNKDQIAPISMGDQGERDGPTTPADMLPPTRLDLFATGTVGDEDEQTPTVEPEHQPFPGTVNEPQYSLVFATAGRAMIADDSGMWVVQRGSLLPDNSKVVSIEQRGKDWVLITSNQRVIEVSRN